SSAKPRSSSTCSCAANDACGCAANDATNNMGALLAPYASTSQFSLRRLPKVAGRERRHEEATRTAPEPAEPYGPRRCGGPEHTAGLSMSVGRRSTHNNRK